MRYEIWSSNEKADTVLLDERNEAKEWATQGMHLIASFEAGSVEEARRVYDVFLEQPEPPPKKYVVDAVVLFKCMCGSVQCPCGNRQHVWHNHRWMQCVVCGRRIPSEG